MDNILQAVINSSQSAATPEKPVPVPRPPVVMPKWKKGSQKKDMTPASQTPIKSKDKSVYHFDFGVPMDNILQAVSNSSRSAATPEKPVPVPRPPVVMPKWKKGSQKKDMTPASQTPIKSKDTSVYHFDFGVPIEYIQQVVSSSSQPAAVLPKVSQLKGAAGPRPQPGSATEPQPSTSSDAGTSDLEKETAQLEAEKAVYLQEKEKLNAVLKTVNVQIEMGKALLYKVVLEKEKIYSAGSLKIDQLDATLNNEKEQKIQTEKLLGEQLAETKRLKEELSQAQKELEEEKLHREVEMARLLAENNKTASMMKAAAMMAQEDLENERAQWLQERSPIQAALKSLKESLDETVEEKDKFITELMSQVHHLEEAQKKSKKRSLWKRFKQLFKRS